MSETKQSAAESGFNYVIISKLITGYIVDNIEIIQMLRCLTVTLLACFAFAVDFVNELREELDTDLVARHTN